MEILGNNKDKQAVAELCQAQIQFKLDSDFLGEDLYMFMFIQKLDQAIKRLKHIAKMCNLDAIQLNISKV